jgi:stage V sporulation protein AF
MSVFLTPLWILFLNNPDIVPKWMEFILISDDITVPVILQLLILEIAVDGLRLAAVNTPQTLSTPLSVVAGIIVGEFAVKSGWFNSESMLYMAFVTVATYSQASFEMGYALKFCRIMILLLTYFLNGWGLALGAALSFLMVCTNHTISGKSYIYPLYPWNWDMIKRKVVRLRLPHHYDGE